MPRSPLPCLLALLLLAAACSSPPAEEGGAGGGCSGAGCGTGGAGGEIDRCPDRSGEGSCRAAGECPEGSECSIGEGLCPGRQCCTLPFSCEPAVGMKPGGFRCDEDDECASGTCLEIRFDLKVCLRACQLLSGGDSCPLGSTCQLVQINGNASVRACIGGDAGAPDPERTACRADRDCVDGRGCKIFGGELLFRDDEAGTFRTGGAQPVCQPLGTVHDTGEACAPAPPVTEVDLIGSSYSGGCEEGGLCLRACIGGDDGVCQCTAAEVQEGRCRGLLCTGPCRGDNDCPNRMVCTLPESDRFAHDPPDLVWGFCEWPFLVDIDWGCYDELDCCKNGQRPDGSDCCEHSSEEPEFCALPPVPEPVTYCRMIRTGTRFTTQCGRPEGKALLGAPCAADADCESALCVAGAAGSSCSAPCFGAVDRCEQILPGTSCCPTQSGELCVEACRSDCEATPVCALRP